MKFIKATFLGHQTVRFESENGELVDHIGGNWTWRNNNPGNIIKGPFANKCGAIGHAGGFAVFPSADIGELALKKLLKTKKYQEKKISTLFEHYAPEQDGNNPKNYVKLVRQFTGIKSDLLLKELTEEEFEKFISAIKRVEGQKVGNIVPVKMKRILKTKEEKNVIVAYLIEEYEKLKRGDFGDLTNLYGIGRTLVALRIFKGMKQSELAAKLQVKESQVSRDESNEYHGASVEKIQKVLDVLGVTLKTKVEYQFKNVV
jgi:integrase